MCYHKRLFLALFYLTMSSEIMLSNSTDSIKQFQQKDHEENTGFAKEELERFQKVLAAEEPIHTFYTTLWGNF
jgi:hypothetical protein